MENVWRRVNVGGQTKAEFEKGELIDKEGKPLTAQKLYETLSKARSIKGAELKVREAAEDIKEETKNPEEIEFIGMVQMMISEERARLGLEPGFYIETERVRLFHSDDWERRESHHQSQRGEYRTVEGFAETQTPPVDPRVSPYAYFRTLSHEILHQASYYVADPLGQDMRGRIGYFTYADGLGRALNEAMTEGINQKILQNHANTLGSRFPDTLDGKPFEWWSRSPSYLSYQKIVTTVANRVDAILYGGTPTTWDNLARGYFNGDRKAFDDIEKALGKEALELLLLLGNPDLFDTSRSYGYIESRIEKYLSGMSSPKMDLSPAQEAGIYAEVMRFRKQPQGPSSGDLINK
jgi:hypothetical protein